MDLYKKHPFITGSVLTIVVGVISGFIFYYLLLAPGYVYAEYKYDDANTIREVQLMLSLRGTGEPARKILQEVKVLHYRLSPKGKSPIEMTLVQAQEINSPAGSQPIVWRLLTNRQVGNPEQAFEIINWYRSRWEIEMFFDVLKTGCRVEKLQLGTKERVEKALMLYMIVTWRVMYLMRLGRNCPELPADLVFDPLEWKSSYLLGKKALPDGIPSINDVIRNLAALGGFLARTSDGEPGAKSIWKGFQRIQDCIYGIQIGIDLQETL